MNYQTDFQIIFLKISLKDYLKGFLVNFPIKMDLLGMLNWLTVSDYLAFAIFEIGSSPISFVAPVIRKDSAVVVLFTFGGRLISRYA